MKKINAPLKIILPALLPMILLSCGDAGQTTDETEATTGLVEEEVTYQSDTTELHGYIVYDNSFEGQRPVVLVVHEWWGHNEYPRSRARMLAEEGYLAMSLDMYGGGKTADHPDDAQSFMMESLSDMDRARARFEAALDLARQHEMADPAKTAAIGYCYGGAVVLHMARFGVDLDGVISYHGTLQTQYPAQPGEVTASVLVCNGADDPFVPEEHRQAFRAEMDAAGVDYEFINYPGAVHAFTNPEATANGERFELPLAYNEAADNASWERSQEFFDEIFDVE